MIMSKLLDDIRLRVEQENKRDVWMIEEILEVVKVEVEARAASEGVKVNSQHNHNSRFHHKSPLHIANSLYAGSGKVQCVYCREKHFSASCQKVNSVSKRKEILLKSGCCFVYLRSNHKSRECSSTKSCRYCHRKHHQSICETHFTSPDTTNDTRGRSETTEPVTNTDSFTSAANSIRGRGTILLQTA